MDTNNPQRFHHHISDHMHSIEKRLICTYTDGNSSTLFTQNWLLSN